MEDGERESGRKQMDDFSLTIFVKRRRAKKGSFDPAHSARQEEKEEEREDWSTSKVTLVVVEQSRESGPCYIARDLKVKLLWAKRDTQYVEIEVKQNGTCKFESGQFPSASSADEDRSRWDVTVQQVGRHVHKTQRFNQLKWIIKNNKNGTIQVNTNKVFQVHLHLELCVQYRNGCVNGHPIDTLRWTGFPFRYGFQ